MEVDLSLQIRYARLVAFAHNRREPELTDVQVGERSGVDPEALRMVRAGQLTKLPAGAADAIATGLGLEDGAYLEDLRTPEQKQVAEEMHERLEMYIQARELGVRRIAARNTHNSSGLARRVSEHLRALAAARIL